MLDPNLIMYYPRLRQQEIYDIVFGRRQTESMFDLRDALTSLWHRLHSPPKQTQGWQPTRTVRT